MGPAYLAVRLPLAPLDELARLRARKLPRGTTGDSYTQADWSDRDLADSLAVGRREVSRWRRDGLTITAADRAATALGEHPSAVWPDWWLLPHIECGTHSGYAEHRRNGETPCPACKRAAAGKVAA